MEKLKIEWTEFDQFGYEEASKFAPCSTDPKNFEHVKNGVVIDSYHSLFGTPRFVIILEDGNIITKKMEGCKVIDYEK